MVGYKVVKLEVVGDTNSELYKFCDFVLVGMVK